jgi:anti-sigma factor RsiW
MTCDELRDDLSAFLDGELPARRRREAEAHLRRCAACDADARALERVMREVQEAPPPPGDLIPTAAILARLPGAAAARASRVERAVRYEIVAGVVGTALVVLVGLRLHPRVLSSVLGSVGRLMLALALGGGTSWATTLLRWDIVAVALLLALDALVLLAVPRQWTLRR